MHTDRAELQDDQLIAFPTADPSLPTFAEKIRLATATDVEVVDGVGALR